MKAMYRCASLYHDRYPSCAAGGFSLPAMIIFLVTASIVSTSLIVYTDNYLRLRLGEKIGAEMVLLDEKISTFIFHYERQIKIGLSNQNNTFSIKYPKSDSSFYIKFIKKTDGDYDLSAASLEKIHELYKFPGKPNMPHGYRVRLIRQSMKTGGACSPENLATSDCRLSSLIYREEPLSKTGNVDPVAVQAALRKMGPNGGLSVTDVGSRTATKLRFGQSPAARNLHISNPVAKNPAGILAIRSVISQQHQPYLSRQDEKIDVDLNMHQHNVDVHTALRIGGMALSQHGMKNNSIVVTAPKIEFKSHKESAETIDIEKRIVTATDFETRTYGPLQHIKLNKMIEQNKDGTLIGCDVNLDNHIKFNSNGMPMLCRSHTWRPIKGKQGASAKHPDGAQGMGGLEGPTGRGFRPDIKYFYSTAEIQHRVPAGTENFSINPLSGYTGKGAPIQCSIVRHNLGWKARLHADGLTWKITTRQHLTETTYLTSACNYLTITVNGKDETHSVLGRSFFK